MNKWICEWICSRYLSFFSFYFYTLCLYLFVPCFHFLLLHDLILSRAILNTTKKHFCIFLHYVLINMEQGQLQNIHLCLKWVVSRRSSWESILAGRGHVSAMLTTVDIAYHWFWRGDMRKWKRQQTERSGRWPSKERLELTVLDDWLQFNNFGSSSLKTRAIQTRNPGGDILVLHANSPCML